MIFTRVPFSHESKYLSIRGIRGLCGIGVLHENSILTPLQSGLIPGDSTTNQLIYLYDTFSPALDSGKKIRVVFRDINKVLDRVLHQCILLKLRAAGVTGKLLSWFSSYLCNRRQKVVLLGASSNWNFIFAGVPLGSLLGPLLFLININDIVSNKGSNIRLFVDETSIFIIVENPISAAYLLNSDLKKIAKWALDWLVTFDPIKAEALLISRKLQTFNNPPLLMLNQQIMEVDTHKHIGIHLSNDGSLHKQISNIK